jgi:hypothetical protein
LVPFRVDRAVCEAIHTAKATQDPMPKTQAAIPSETGP